MSTEEGEVIRHFESNHCHASDGRLSSLNPRRKICQTWVSRISQLGTVTVLKKKQFGESAAIMKEYFILGHAKEVPVIDLQKPPQQVFYMPMHEVLKKSSTTTKTRVVFDASVTC